MPSVVGLPAAVGIHIVPVVFAAAVYPAVAHFLSAVALFLGAVAVSGVPTIASVSAAAGTPVVARISTVADIAVVCWHPWCCHPCCYWRPPVGGNPTFAGLFAVAATWYCCVLPVHYPVAC